MARPEVSSAAEELYASLGVLASEDEDNDWHLLKFCDALVEGLGIAMIDTYVSDSDDRPGWQIVFDPDDSPEEALPYLGQFVGVELEPELTVAEQRLKIKLPEGFRRGTLAALEAAIQRTLTGSKTVLIEERPDGEAYQLYIRTFASETPSEDATLAAILTQKPIGIVLEPAYEAITGQSWDDLQASATDWDDVESTYADWSEVRSTLP